MQREWLSRDDKGEPLFSEYLADNCATLKTRTLTAGIEGFSSIKVSGIRYRYRAVEAVEEARGGLIVPLRGGGASRKYPGVRYLVYIPVNMR